MYIRVFASARIVHANLGLTAPDAVLDLLILTLKTKTSGKSLAATCQALRAKCEPGLAEIAQFRG